MGKKHPLDIFRSSEAGFDSASRERRTVLGRVVASAPRSVALPAPATPVAAPTSATLPPAVAATRARVLGAAAAPSAQDVTSRERVSAGVVQARPLRPPLPGRTVAPAAPAMPEREASTPRPAPRPRVARPAPDDSLETRRALPAAVNRILLASACVLVGGLALWTLAASMGGPALKSSAPAGAAAGAKVYRIQAAVYPGTPAGQAAAFGARDHLRELGFRDVDVAGQPTDMPDVYSRFDLLVGQAGSEAALAEALAGLHALKTWPGTQKAPFKEALVVGFPAR